MNPGPTRNVGCHDRAERRPPAVEAPADRIRRAIEEAKGTRPMVNDPTGGRSPTTVAHCLLGLSFPAGREQLVAQARKRNANRDVIELLERLPNRRYEGMADVERAVMQLED
jgi:Protein of unknown function (DUF2795)